VIKDVPNANSDHKHVLLMSQYKEIE